MGTTRGHDLRALACTVVGASSGGFIRQWLDPLSPSGTRSLAATLVLTALSALVVGFAVAVSDRGPATVVLLAAGGAAGSVGVAAARAAMASPAQSALGLAIFFAGAVAGTAAGGYVAFLRANRQLKERC